MRPVLAAAAMSALAAIASSASADMTNVLSPVGLPQFTESITQGGWAPVTTWSQYVGLRVVAPGDAFIEKVTGLANPVAGTQEYSASGRLTESWWANAMPSSFSATYELESLLGRSAAQNPASYVGLRVETALAGADGQITASRAWIYTNGGCPASIPGFDGNWLPASIGGWYLTGLSLGDANWHGGTIAAARLASPVPAPGAALLGLIGLGLAGWLKRRAV